jgi:hypothetical protein
MTPLTVVVGATLLAGLAGALFGYLITGTVQGTLLGALAIAFFGGKNAVISVINPSLLVALGIGALGGLAGGWCLLGSLAPEHPGWIGGIAGAGIGTAEMLLWWWRKRVERT